MATGTQIRAARALAQWSSADLARNTGISSKTILNIEIGRFHARPDTMQAIVAAFDKVGVEFTENEGVRRRPEGIEVFEGHERFHDFTGYVQDYLTRFGGDVCISASDERLFLKYRKDPEQYRATMKALVDSGKITVRILAEESNFNSVFAEMRKLSGHNAAPTSFYAFGRNLALISFTHATPPYVVLFRNSPFADAFRQSFDAAWASAEIKVKHDK